MYLLMNKVLSYIKRLQRAQYFIAAICVSYTWPTPEK